MGRTGFRGAMGFDTIAKFDHVETIHSIESLTK